MPRKPIVFPMKADYASVTYNPLSEDKDITLSLGAKSTVYAELEMDIEDVRHLITNLTNAVLGYNPFSLERKTIEFKKK